MHHASYIELIRHHLRTAYLLDNEKTEKMLPVLLDVLNSHMVTLEEVFADGDLEELSKAGHAVKGALLNLGLPELAEQALLIEQRGKSGDLQADFNHMIRQLKTAVETISVK